MTINEIQKILKTSFKNGYYITRPSYDTIIQVYINKNGNTWHCQDGMVFSTELTKFELIVDDWEIVL